MLLFINAILFSIRYGPSKDRLYKIMTFYLIGLFGFELGCHILWFTPQSNFFFTHYHLSGQFLILNIFYFHLFKSPAIKKAITVICILTLMINLSLYIMSPDLYYRFNLFEIIAFSSILIAYALLYLYRTLGEAKQYFYFAIGSSMYFICSTLIFASGNVELVFIKDPYVDIWVFNSLFSITYQILVYKEWWFIHKKEKNADER